MSAHDRFNVASQDPSSPERLYIPLFEALNWAGVLEDAMRPHSDQLLSAIRFARNRVVHDWADAVEGRNIPNPVGQPVRALGAGVGLSGVVAPPVVWDWFWRARRSLPTGTNNRGGPAYDQLLDGNPVRQALDALRARF